MNAASGPRAFATTTALGIIALIAVMFLAVGAMLTTDGRRTIQQSTDGQLRQMLLAGAAIAYERAAAISDAPTTQPVVLDLPSDLAARNGTLQIQLLPATPPSLHIRITAIIDGRSMSQTLTLDRENGRWIATETLLEPGISNRPPLSRPTKRPATQPVEPHSPPLR